MLKLAGAVKQALYSAGYYARRLRRERFPGVAVLCYHGVRDDSRPPGTMVFEGLHVLASELEAQCHLLRETCHPISLDDWRAARRGGPPLPPRPVLMTFDDGYRTVFTVARPILRRYSIPAVVFVCSEPVERQQLFWHDAVAQVQGEGQVAQAKAVRFDEWQALRTRCRREAGLESPHAPLTIAEVKELADDRSMEVGAHTCAHPILARAPKEDQREQIRENKVRLERWTGRPVTAFAYPNGQPGQDYTADTVELVGESGFEFGFTARHGFARPEEPDLERSRFFMLAGISAAELAHRLCESWRG
ncbi:MAG: polysaccharide deacetylase family protein [Candidatus Binatia bacterium]